MNDAAANTLPMQGSELLPEGKSKKPFNWGFLGYSILFAAIGAGWMLRDEGLVDPNYGVGYWLGIVGSSLMLLLLLYPAGKKSKLLHRLGWAKYWFRFHMILGLVGPLLVLYHSNFRVHAINSKVALYSMLAVAVSGIIGRHFYARIHRGLYGKRTRFDELRQEIADAMENNRGLAVILPNFSKELYAVSAEFLGDQYTRTISVRQSLAWTFKYYYVRARLYFRINREIRVRAVLSETIRSDATNLQKAAHHYMDTQVSLLRRVAQLSFYERLFSIWHIFHMPLFILLTISAVIHILAVHMF